MLNTLCTRLLTLVWLYMLIQHKCSNGGSLHLDVGVAVRGERDGSPHARMKRAVDESKVGLTNAERIIMLRKHNSLRTERNASNMIIMEWDNDLEALAQKYSEECKFQHSTSDFRTNIGRFSYVGENLFAGTGELKPADVIQGWYDEVQFYDYKTTRCVPGEMCGHYTQVVWASSTAVGCGVKYCNPLKCLEHRGFTKGYYVVCHYGPGGNAMFRRPYSLDPSGKVCTKCPKEAKYCVRNLCSLRPMIGSGSLQIQGVSFQRTALLFLLTVIVHLQ